MEIDNASHPRREEYQAVDESHVPPRLAIEGDQPGQHRKPYVERREQPSPATGETGEGDQEEDPQRQVRSRIRTVALDHLRGDGWANWQWHPEPPRAAHRSAPGCRVLCSPISRERRARR